MHATNANSKPNVLLIVFITIAKITEVVSTPARNRDMRFRTLSIMF